MTYFQVGMCGVAVYIVVTAFVGVVYVLSYLLCLAVAEAWERIRP